MPFITHLSGSHIYHFISKGSRITEHFSMPLDTYKLLIIYQNTYTSPKKIYYLSIATYSLITHTVLFLSMIRSINHGCIVTILSGIINRENTAFVIKFLFRQSKSYYHTGLTVLSMGSQEVRGQSQFAAEELMRKEAWNVNARGEWLEIIMDNHVGESSCTCLNVTSIWSLVVE